MQLAGRDGDPPAQSASSPRFGSACAGASSSHSWRQTFPSGSWPVKETHATCANTPMKGRSDVPTSLTTRLVAVTVLHRLCVWHWPNAHCPSAVHGQSPRTTRSVESSPQNWLGVSTSTTADAPRACDPRASWRSRCRSSCQWPRRSSGAGPPTNSGSRTQRTSVRVNRRSAAAALARQRTGDRQKGPRTL